MSTATSLVFDEFAAHVSPGKVAFLRGTGLEFAIGRREGPFIWDVDGTRRLINCHCNGGTFNLGHRHPAIVATLVRALEEWDIGNHHFPSGPRARLARRLAELTPGRLAYTVFGVSGGEAIDLAIKVARRATGRRRIVSISGGYHGHTGLAVATGDERFSKPFLCDSPDFVQVPFNDLEAMRAAVDHEVAAVILETIPATLGMPIPHAGYLPAVKALCAAAGAVYIADEVQTGLGRTGRLWAVEHFGVEPDVLVTAKGLSGGIYPITATVLTPELAEVFAHDPFSHVSTFGGAELGCLVAEKVLELSSAPGFLANVLAVGERIRDGVIALGTRHAGAGLEEVRAKGCFLGVKFADLNAGPTMMRLCFEAGLLCFLAGNDPSVLQLLPPLIADAALADEIVERLGRAVAAYARARAGASP
jgi:acetylornithine/succinyldiaminopimelate/putrescine aminotransferase